MCIKSYLVASLNMFIKKRWLRSFALMALILIESMYIIQCFVANRWNHFFVLI